MKKIILVFILTLTANSLYAQQTFRQYLYWIRYQNQLVFSPKFYWSNEADNRRFFDPDVQNQFIIHSRAHYKTGRWDVAGGMTTSWAYAQRPENGYQNVTTELRPVVEASHDLPLGKINLMNRLRIDNRFFEASEDQSIWNHSTFVMRFRYRLQARIPVKSTPENAPLITLKIADEIMINDRKNTFDQNRIYASGEFFLNKKLSVETQYIYIYQQRFGREDFFSRHVFRFSVLHKIMLKKV